ncbi:hypothetical protein [Wolbachia endosymbiont (group A) of Lasioglossum villosulum]|uniref:hypothetical protein n=1 Tax=Wolbachia endosymbiont (group A) of Lasioglossum villosulum TaxID=3066202 RepID=UPI00313333D7
MLNEERPQDFELIELLIQEAGKAIPSASAQQKDGLDKSFKARFQSYIYQIPSYMHSVEKKGFFPHFFFGSFSTLLDTKIAKELGIEKIYFSFDGPQTLKVAVIKKGEIRNEAGVIDKVRLFVISEQGARSATRRFSYGELRDALGRLYPARFQPVFDNKGKLKVKLVTINKDKINQQRIFVAVEDKNLYEDDPSQDKFKEIEKGLWSNPEDDIEKLAGSDKERVKESSREVLKKISEIHYKYESSLEYGKEGRKAFREAAHHGFIAGALNNFRYRYNLRVYLEQFAGRGYADIVLLARGPNRALDSIPIIIELKAATSEELKKLKKGEEVKENSKTTPAKALEQAIEYTKGFQPNVQRVLTTADNILCVGVNLDYPSCKRQDLI